MEKIAERYWLPKSKPWRLRVVGLWIRQNTWSSSRVADLARVEPHLDRLGVARAAPADLLVAGVRHMPAGIADSGLQHPVDLAEGRLDAPEASGGEGRALGPLRAVALERRRRAERPEFRFLSFINS